MLSKWTVAALVIHVAPAVAWPIYVFPAAYYAVSDPDKHADNDYGFRFAAGYMVNDQWSIEALSEFTTYKLDASVATLRSRGISFEGVYNIFPEYRLQPLLLGGAGWMRTSINGGYYDSPVIRAGVGLQWRVPNTNFGLRGDAVLRREFDSDAAPDKSNFNDPILSLGFTYRFGTPTTSVAGSSASPVETSKGTTVPEQRPSGGLDTTVGPAKGQPVEPIFHGTVSKGVVTPQDSDGDGVDDAQDKCPDTPPGAVIDADGCIIYMKK